MRFVRLLGMGLPEIAGRGRQEAWKWLERIGAAGAASYAAGAERALVRRFTEAGARRFFDGAVSAATPSLLRRRLPVAGDRLIQAADRICEGRFDLLGYRGLSFGKPIDWHLDPISGARAPLVHWSRIDPLDPAGTGDCKVVWELNRHQWLIRLGQAYRLTGEERYARTLAGLLGEWMQANPPGLGINWTSSLEVSLRLISWCWALHLVRDSEALSPALLAAMISGIAVHAARVERYLSRYHSPNTHLTGEALGLVYAGLLLPELAAAVRWRERGSRILAEQIESQVLPDGVHFEQSTCYQRYTLEIGLHFLILAARNGLAVPPVVEDRVLKMLEFVLAVRCPDGSIPGIGDADGGWLLPLDLRAPDDARGIFSTAAAWFRRPDLAWAAGGPAPETLWLMGPAGLAAFDLLRPSPPQAPPSRLFAEGGYAVMRSGWETGAHQLIFDVGPLGCRVSAGHGHADLLSLQCSAFGEPFLIDAGTCVYTSGSAWRDHFRGSAAHSTVMVDGEGQAEPAGPFAWKTRPRARLRSWLSTEALTFADAEHDAYGRLTDPVLHRRRVVFVGSRYWIVVDDLQGAAAHRVDLRFQFAPVEVTVEHDHWARARGPRGHELLIRPFARADLAPAVLAGAIAPIAGWISPDYGRREPAPVLIYSALAALPLRILTLLLPAGPAPAPLPAVVPLFGSGPDPEGLVFPERRETVRLGERGVSVEVE